MGIYPGKCTSNTSLKGKVAIITGCSSGIGKRTALDFYRRGCKVIMACKDIIKGESAKKDILYDVLERNEDFVGELFVKKLDLGSIKSIKKFAEEILNEEEEVHLLINNAGVSGIYPRAFTEDGLEKHFGVNHLGHFLLTILLLPKLIASGPARIVNVSASIHGAGNIDFEDINMDKSYSWHSAYANTKLANILFTKELARRLKGKNVNVYALHPGVARTDIDRHLNSGFHFAWNTILGLLFYKTPEEGAQTTIYCAVDENLSNESGYYYVDCKRAIPNIKAKDMEMAKKLWETSWEMLKLGDYDPFTVNPGKRYCA